MSLSKIVSAKLTSIVKLHYELLFIYMYMC